MPIIAITHIPTGATVQRLIATEAYVQDWIARQDNAADLTFSVERDTDLPLSQFVAAFRDRVTAERTRRIIEGAMFDVPGLAVQVALQGRPEDQTTLGNLAQAAILRTINGDTTTPTSFMDRDNNLHTLLPEQIRSLWLQGVAYVELIHKRSWIIKEMDPITTDPTDDALWVLP